jgi:pantoate--beta-alanine ligase
MGALHDGHLTLMRDCRAQCDIVVATIFVNPTQFGPNEDLSRYPRTLDSDLECCRAEGVDIVFTPANEEMYPGPTFLGININTLAEHLCGTTRPGHFNGVLQVVNKLFNIVQPTDAWFGQKDLQQFILIQTMVREFNIPVQLHRAETVREHDGLALSSRNRYLSNEERALAPIFPKNLHDIVRQLHEQPIADALKSASARLEAKGFKIDYLAVTDYQTLQPVWDVIRGQTYVLAGAVYLGKTRLIDNIIFQH